MTNRSVKEALSQACTHTETQVHCVLCRLNITVASDDPNRFSSGILVRTCSGYTDGMHVKKEPDQRERYTHTNTAKHTLLMHILTHTLYGTIVGTELSDSVRSAGSLLTQ